MAADEPGPDPDPTRDTGAAEVMRARALVVHDLAAAGLDSAAAVDIVEDAVQGRAWWVAHWPDGASFVAGQVAQDVQDRLLDDSGVRWPRCPAPACADREEHPLALEPELGPDPHWVCELSGIVVAPLGALPRAAGADDPGWQGD